MNQQIVEYLNQNKDQYSRDALVKQLQQSGHSEENISVAVAHVYGQNAPVSPKVPMKYAGFWVRFAAVLIDGIVLMPIHFIVGISLVSAGGENTFIGTPVSLLITWIYYILMTHYYQATLGKKAVGIKVQSVSGGNASIGNITLRETIGKLISMFILYIGYIMVAFTGRKQALHDMMAKTVVVYKDPNKKSNVIAIVIIAVVVSIAIIGIFASIVLVSLNSAREKARDASFKATASSIVPAAILCCDSYDGVKKSLNISPGENVCSPEDSASPSVYPEDLTLITIEKNCDSNGNFILHVEPSLERSGSCVDATLTQDGATFDGCR